MGITLGQLKSMSLDLSEQTLGFIVDARLTDQANLALAKLHDIVVHTREDYKKEEKDYTLVSGTETYALPALSNGDAADFYKELCLFYISSSDRIPIHRFNPRQPHGFRAPQSTATIRMWYVPQFKRLVNDAQEIDNVFPAGWEDFLIGHMTQYCLFRAKLDLAPAKIMIREAEERITGMADPRGQSESMAVEDVHERYGPVLPSNTQGLSYAIVGNKLHIMQEWPPAA